MKLSSTLLSFFLISLFASELSYGAFDCDLFRQLRKQLKPSQTYFRREYKKQFSEFKGALAKQNKEVANFIKNRIRDQRLFAFEINAPGTPQNGKIFVIPNERLLQLLPENRLGMAFISLTNSGLAPWDAGKWYLEKEHWLTNPWNRFWHLWLSIGNDLYNDSLIQIKRYSYYEKLEKDWKAKPIDPNREYDWLNLVIEPIVFLPAGYTHALQLVTEARVAASDARAEKIVEEGLSGKTADETFRYMDEGNLKLRQEIYEFLNRGDGPLQSYANPYYRTLGFEPHVWNLYPTKADYLSLKETNCLGLLYWLGNERFISLVSEKMGEANAKRIAYVAEILGMRNTTEHHSGELIRELLKSPFVQVILLHGYHPAQKITNDDELLHYQIPADKMPYSDKKTMSIINDPTKRRIISTTGN